MKKIIITTILLFLGMTIKAQIILPGQGVDNLLVGSSPDEVVWTLGFKGINMSKEGIPASLKVQAEAVGLDFDYVYNYQHIMSLPVSTVYFKDDKAVMIVLSSYAEYNEMLCLGISTKEGLNFWDTQKELKKLYGKEFEEVASGLEFYYYKNKGLGVSIEENKIRTMTIFSPQ